MNELARRELVQPPSRSLIGVGQAKAGLLGNGGLREASTLEGRHLWAGVRSLEMGVLNMEDGGLP
jgi:hypothetical protein